MLCEDTTGIGIGPGGGGCCPVGGAETAVVVFARVAVLRYVKR